MTNTFIGYHSVVDTCIIDEGVNIGKLCYIGFESSLLAGDDDITMLKKRVNVPSHTVIGRNSKVLPHANTQSSKGNPITLSTILSQRGIVQKSWANKEVQRNERKGVHVT